MDDQVLYDVFRQEIREQKIPISLGKTCPVKCTFCYEKDHSYRPTIDPPLTTQEHWKFILEEIQKYPTKPGEAWLLGGNEYMEWTDIFLHPKAMDWLEEFLDTTDKQVIFFTVGYTKPDRIQKLVEKYPGRINYELSVITLGESRKKLMPHAPTVKQVLELIGGSAVTSSNFYSFGPDTMSKDAITISKINPDCILWMGCLTPLKYIDEETSALMRHGRRYLPEESRKIYNAGLPNTQMIHTESYISTFLARQKILKTFDACELEKKDNVVVSASIYRLLSTLRKNRARYLYVPNQMLGGDSDCSTLLTFNDVAQRLNGETQVYLPKVIMEHPSKVEKDITGVTFDEFKERFPRIRFKILHKVNSKMSNGKLYEKGYLKNVVEDYLDNPLAKKIAEAPLPN
ncbi:MAG: radical SAM protein [Nitrospinota bacterium]|nr:radical SAM protein [Nitrospinota bacterium]